MAARRRSRSRVTSGYYFVLDPNYPQNQVIVYMTDAEYFDRTGFQSDWHISAIIAIPRWLEEISDGIFSSELSREETATLLLRDGFRTSEAFRGLMLEDRQNIRVINRSAGETEEDLQKFPLEPARPWYERLDGED